MTFWKCSSKFFTYELSRAKTMVLGLASTFRATQGAPTTPAAPAAPAASFRKSRRLGSDGVGCAMRFPFYVALVRTPARNGPRSRGHPGRVGSLADDPAPW